MTQAMPAVRATLHNPPMPATFAERHPSLRALAHRDYRLLLAGFTLVNIVMPFQYLTQVFWVQDHYHGHATLYVSLIAASRGLAQITFALIGGAIADRFERRKVLLVTESASLALNAVIAALMVALPFGSATLAVIIGCTFAATSVMSIDSPARSASIPSIVGMKDLTSGIALNSLAAHLTLPLTLPWVGILNGAFDPGWVYVGSLTAWMGILPLIAMLRYRSAGGARTGSMVSNIAAGVRYSRASVIISGVLAMVVVIQLVGMPVATPLGPVFHMEVLGYSPRQVGLMGMFWGGGALAGSLFFARMQWLATRGATLCTVALLLGVAVLGLGYSRFLPLTAASNFAIGATFMATNLTAATLIQHTVRDEMRGRVMGLFPFTLGFAHLSTAPIGLLGQSIGLALLFPLLGWATVALCLAVMGVRPRLLRLRVTPEMHDAPARAG